MNDTIFTKCILLPHPPLSNSYCYLISIQEIFIEYALCARLWGLIKWDTVHTLYETNKKTGNSIPYSKCSCGCESWGGICEEDITQAMFQESKSKHIRAAPFQGFCSRKQLECTFLYYSKWERASSPSASPKEVYDISTQGSQLIAQGVRLCAPGSCYSASTCFTFPI